VRQEEPFTQIPGEDIVDEPVSLQAAGTLTVLHEDDRTQVVCEEVILRDGVVVHVAAVVEGAVLVPEVHADAVPAERARGDEVPAASGDVDAEGVALEFAIDDRDVIGLEVVDVDGDIVAGESARADDVPSSWPYDEPVGAIPDVDAFDETVLAAAEFDRSADDRAVPQRAALPRSADHPLEGEAAQIERRPGLESQLVVGAAEHVPIQDHHARDARAAQRVRRRRAHRHCREREPQRPSVARRGVVLGRCLRGISCSAGLPADQGGDRKNAESQSRRTAHGALHALSIDSRDSCTAPRAVPAARAARWVLMPER
jgi:hypothetical protein